MRLLPVDVPVEGRDCKEESLEVMDLVEVEEAVQICDETEGEGLSLHCSVLLSENLSWVDRLAITED